MTEPFYTDGHSCHFCITYVYDGYEDKEKTKRHWLSDCRPDLVEHEIGDTCTWAYRRVDMTNVVTGKTIEALPENYTCYAYLDESKPGEKTWTMEHKHFHKDGPM